MHNKPGLLTSLLRGTLLMLHLLSGVLLAMFYPYLSPRRQRRTLRSWGRQLLSILKVGIQIEGIQPARGEGACLIVANHISWLDSLVLNTIHPSRFVTDSRVRSWPLIGWLCQRGGSIFIEPAMRQNAPSAIQRIENLLEHGVCVTIFPEGPATNGRQVGHFHSALIQPAIDTKVRLCPIALRYQDMNGQLSNGAAFIGDMTLLQSAWRILRSPRFNALLIFTPALTTTDENRRVLARAARQAIVQALQNSAKPLRTLTDGAREPDSPCCPNLPPPGSPTGVTQPGYSPKFAD